MDANEFVLIDGLTVPLDGEKNLLELIRKAGISLPTFCYYSELSIYGACRMCMVENNWGELEAACSTPPKAGMKIQTNTERLRRYRRMILELLLSNHCRDCTTCRKNNSCRLQELATRFGIERVRFPNTADSSDVEDSSLCIRRDRHKCILCGDCVRMCHEIQNVGAIDFALRGSKMTISTAFDIPLAESDCVGCGQCAAVCPTGAIVVKNDTRRFWDALSDKNINVIVQIAPAVRVAVGRELGLVGEENSMGRIVAALRRLGVDEIFDTSTGADITVLEESAECLAVLEEKRERPLFTSCCPAWVSYCEKKHPDLMPFVSSCRSPMQMFASLVKEHYRASGRKIFHVAIMPCTAKKYEAARAEFTHDGSPLVDCVITSQELVHMIRESGLQFAELEPEAVDMPFGTISGAGVIFGVTGGVTEAVLRRLFPDKTTRGLRAAAFAGVRGMRGSKEFAVQVDDKIVKIAIVSGLANAEKLIGKIRAGEKYDFVEVMACPGGCVSGGGQPFAAVSAREERGNLLYAADRMSTIKRSEDNPLMSSLYESFRGRVHGLLHVHYQTGDK
ncbi:MAG: [FeFe] hydrogenase, group A [Desulfovibrio sp.]|jgi:NADH-quinone oxidoreductase subunit G|nr:[FeFe] hydrogenase, group A [Desulfovibrio sp.]